MQLQLEFPNYMTSEQAYELVKKNSKVGWHMYSLESGVSAFDEIKKLATFQTEEELHKYIDDKRNVSRS